MHRYHPNGFKILNENHTYTETERMSEACRQLEAYLQLNEAGPLAGAAAGQVARQILRTLGKGALYGLDGNDVVSHGLGADGVLPKIPGLGDPDDYNDDPGPIVGGLENMMTGGGAGMAIGSVVPGVGTGVGGAVGAAAALLYSLIKDMPDYSGGDSKYTRTPMSWSGYGRGR